MLHSHVVMLIHILHCYDTYSNKDIYTCAIHSVHIFDKMHNTENVKVTPILMFSVFLIPGFSFEYDKVLFDAEDT